MHAKIIWFTERSNYLAWLHIGSCLLHSRVNSLKMEPQPTEILEHIFKQLPNLKAVQNCFNTCDRWRQTIENMFKDKGNTHYILLALY